MRVYLGESSKVLPNLKIGILGAKVHTKNVLWDLTPYPVIGGGSMFWPPLLWPRTFVKSTEDFFEKKPGAGEKFLGSLFKKHWRFLTVLKVFNGEASHCCVFVVVLFLSVFSFILSVIVWFFFSYFWHFGTSCLRRFNMCESTFFFRRYFCSSSCCREKWNM